MTHLWYKQAIIYQLDVESYLDSNGDGIGDFQGLTERLDYLADLGITCLWLLPFYPTTHRDDGYDIIEYRAIDPRYGSLQAFRAFVREARERGIRVMIDLVVQHTSNQHPWFKAAREGEGRYRDYYIWSTDPPEREHIIFPGEQHGNWRYDEKVGACYRHTFYDYQPDLDFFNPAVREEIYRIMEFWLELGVGGFRLDAVPFLIDDRGVEGIESPHQYLREMRATLERLDPDAVFLAEAAGSPEQVRTYFGEDDEMHLVTNFLLNQYLFLALAQEEAQLLARSLTSIVPTPPPTGEWANFLRNHDELNLDKLPEEARNLIFATFAPHEEMRIYGRGIRRRLAPMLEGDRDRLVLAHSLLLALPGTPILYYGDEIGMGDLLSLKGRMSVRTGMQWSQERNGGFSPAASERLVHPVVSEGPYGYGRVNVASQREQAGSLLNWIRRAIRQRRACPEIGAGSCRVLDSGHPAVLATLCEGAGRRMMALHNLSGQPCTPSLDLAPSGATVWVDLLADRSYAPLSPDNPSFEIGRYGYRWLRPADQAPGPS